jgi:hypothetical protein
VSFRRIGQWCARASRLQTRGCEQERDAGHNSF